MPKPPPTSGVMTRNFSGSVLNTGADQVLDQPAALRVGVQRPAAGRRHRSRRSRRAPPSRRRRCGCSPRSGCVTCAALANSASVAALSPISQSNAMLCVTSGHTSGAPASVAVARSVMAGSNVVIDRDQLRGVARRLTRFGDDERDRIADVAHRAVGQRPDAAGWPCRSRRGSPPARRRASVPMPSAFRSAAV